MISIFTEMNKSQKQIDWLSKVNINFNKSDLEKIPEKGAFITISNRPIGFLEEILIKELISQKRKDFYFLDNQELAKETAFHKNYLENNSIFEFKNILKKESGLCLFPVGNVSNFKAKGDSLSDSVWDKTIIKEIDKSDTKIIPIYIKIENENFLKMQGLFLKSKLTYDLVSSLIEYNNLTVNIIIGKPINKNKYCFKNTSQFGRFLRAKLYGLGSKLKIDYFYSSKKESIPVVEAVDKNELHNELQSISDTNKIGTHGDFDIFLTKAKKIPIAIKEIGRLREITFRNVGEGTNGNIDLDEYDLHYLHLFVYDREHKKIAGAYRLGDGKYIMETMGKKGFYIRSLFKIKRPFNKYLEQSLELGRSFVADEYQNQRWPLFLLWQGITYYITNSPYLKYIIGPVSISSTYSKISKSFIVSYIMKYHWDEKLASYIEPKTAFKPDFDDVDYEILLETTGDSVKLLDEIIGDVDPLHNKIPILIKKYFSKQAKIIGFNLDPDFNDALDGFMLTNIKNIELNELKAFKKFNKEEYAY